jgi:hypothetical protein
MAKPWSTWVLFRDRRQVVTIVLTRSRFATVMVMPDFFQVA